MSHNSPNDFSIKGLYTDVHVERRFNLRLYEYWLEVRGEKPYPREDDIDPDALKDYWDQCFLIQTRDIDQGGNYNYTYLGKAISEAYRLGVLDLRTGAIVAPTASHTEEKFERVRASGQPILEEGEFNNSRGKRIKYRQCLLPLGENAAHIESIFTKSG